MTVGKSGEGNYAVALADNKTRGVWDATEVAGDLYRIIDEDEVPECDWERVDALKAEAQRGGETYFVVIGVGDEGPMSEGVVADFATREEAEKDAANRRVNEFQARYRVEERQKESLGTCYINLLPRDGKWVATISDEPKRPSGLALLRTYDSREAAVSEKRSSVLETEICDDFREVVWE